MDSENLDAKLRVGVKALHTRLDDIGHQIDGSNRRLGCGIEAVSITTVALVALMLFGAV